VHHPVPTLAIALGTASAWCELTLLHINVKGCFFVEDDDAEGVFVRLYLGGKQYQDLANTHPVDLQLRTDVDQAHGLRVDLEGESGPYGTRDFRLQFEALPHGDDGSLIRLDYSLSFGGGTSVLMRLYLATAGRGRVGFSIVDVDEQGAPTYVRGVRGMIERNTMRFYLALQAYLDTSNARHPDGLQPLLRHWFALTERYPKQLRELDEPAYVDQKLRQYERQQSLQAQIDARLREDNPQASR
jgi:hypothetical protein